jgi:PAS domain S-box-containing protein
MKDKDKTKEQLLDEIAALRKRLTELEKDFNAKSKDFEEFRKAAAEVDKELEGIGMELAISLSEVFEALRGISAGDPEVRIPEESEFELCSKLKYMINSTAENIAEIVEQSHEFAIGIAELFEVLKRVSRGDLNARVSGISPVELLESLKELTNGMIESVSRAEDDMRRSEERYRTVFENTGTATVIVEQGIISLANREFEKLSGYSKEEIQGRKKWAEFLVKGDVEKMNGHYRRWLADPDSVPDSYEGRMVDRDGNTKDIFVTMAMIPGTRISVASLLNITERKKAEETIARLSHQNELILNSAGEGIFGLDLHGNHTFVNPSAARMLGYETEELIGKPSHTTWHHTRRDGSPYPEKDCPIYAAYKNGLVYHVGDEIFWKKNGTSFFVEYTSTPIFENGALAGAVVTFRDITQSKVAEEERLKLHEQLIQAQKMEAVGQLAGGVAHDFNNILTAMLGYVGLLQMSIKGDTNLKKYTDQIISACDRAATLTRRLLTFSRKELISLGPVNLNVIIKELEKLLLRVIGEDVELKTFLTDDNMVAMADSGQVEQILMNLVTNARDAMPEGGLLTITTESIEMDDEYIRTHGYGKPGRYAVISVSDTGEGMDEKTRERIFEPFFTTKEVGKGTGLGLAMVYGIVRQHNGHINCYSEPGRGTTFRIYLPLIETPTKAKKQVAVPAIAEGTETVLLAEDDVAVRASTREILQEFGYRVIEAVDGEDAVNKFKKDRERIQLVLLDVIMPKKNGREAYETMKEIRSDIKVIFMSGYTADVIHKKGFLEGRFGLILKPVSPTQLLRKIREVLDKRT